MDDVTLTASQPWWGGVIFKDPTEIMHAQSSKFVPRGRLDPYLTYVLVDLRGGPPFFLKKSLEEAVLWVIIGVFRNLEIGPLTVLLPAKTRCIHTVVC